MDAAFSCLGSLILLAIGFGGCILEIQAREWYAGWFWLAYIAGIALGIRAIYKLATYQPPWLRNTNQPPPLKGQPAGDSHESDTDPP